MDDRLVIPAVDVALDGLQQRLRISADNVANIQTPGYKARSVEFESALDAALGSNPYLDSSSLSGAAAFIGCAFTWPAPPAPPWCLRPCSPRR